MDISTLDFQISELHEHVGNLFRKIREGKITEDDHVSLTVDLGHILDHVCLAWNLRDLTMEQMGNLSQADFEHAMYTVPNFGNIRRPSQSEEYKPPNKSRHGTA